MQVQAIDKYLLNQASIERIQSRKHQSEGLMKMQWSNLLSLYRSNCMP